MKNFRKIAYIILSVLVGILLVVATVASFEGDSSLFTGTGTLASQWFPIALLGVYALVQIGCLALYRFGHSVYKIGFALLHLGILIMLVGFLAGAIGGEKYYQNFVVGRYTDVLVGEDGELYHPGYDVGVADFTVERYEPDENGYRADKAYRADLRFRTPEGEVESAELRMNHTYRRNGLKYYLMGYNEGKTTTGQDGQTYSLLNGTLVQSYDAQNYADLYEKVLADYPDTALDWRFFNWEQGAYSSSSGSRDENDSWKYYAAYSDYPCYGHVSDDNGRIHVQVYPKLVTLLIKRDPGEYAVLAGMGLTVAGTVMTCLFRKRRRPTDGESERKGAGK